MAILDLIKLDIFFTAGYYRIGHNVIKLYEVGFEVGQLSGHDLNFLQFDHVLKLIDNNHIAHLMVFARQAKVLLIV
jgi:hypothetical protein